MVYRIKFQKETNLTNQMSHSNIDLIPRSTKSSSNLRHIRQPMSKKNFIMTPKPCEQMQRPKFRPIDLHNTARGQKESVNQLDSKYNVYKHGSPNFYSYTIQSHTAQNIKNQIQTLDLPFIDGVIRELNSKTGKENSANLRDYDMYPNLLKIHQTHKFRDLLSDKQELKDFLKWFQTSCSMIDQKQTSLTKKFHQKQTIISSGFGEITQQISKLSKTRSDILKMLWNKEAQEVEHIVQHLTSKVLQMEKQHLTVLSQVHEQYQEQVDNLKRQNHELNKKLNDQTSANLAYINTLRCDRKVMKKQELAIKKLIDANRTTVKENLSLLDENTKLIMNCSMFTKFPQNQENALERRKTFQPNVRDSQISEVEQIQPELNFLQARMLMYRRLEIADKKQKAQKTMKGLKKTLPKSIQKKSRKQVQSHPLLPQQVEEKKQSLLKYLKKRMQENPFEKQYIDDDFFHEDDHNLDTSEIEDAIKQVLGSKEVVLYLKNEEKIKCVPELESRGVNTAKQFE